MQLLPLFPSMQLKEVTLFLIQGSQPIMIKWLGHSGNEILKEDCWDSIIKLKALYILIQFDRLKSTVVCRQILQISLEWKHITVSLYIIV